MILNFENFDLDDCDIFVSARELINYLKLIKYMQPLQ